MLERGEICSSAAIATGLTARRGEQITPDRTTLSLQHNNDRCTCNNENIYAVPRVELQENEWIDPDSIDAEISRLVAGSSTTTTTATITRNNPRRCCRTSTSSGYSSHSPPLSAGSYSCYASATGCQSFVTIKDQFGRGLAVIHEGETIPRPIWPSAPPEFYHDDSNTEYDLEHLRSGIYACCSCVYPYSYCEWNQEQSGAKSAREVLLELSRTLNSVIENETDVTPEEILRNISHTVAQGMGLKKTCYEHIGCNSLSPAKKCPSLKKDENPTLTCGKNLSPLSCNKVSVSKVNPINSKLYGNSNHTSSQNSLWNIAQSVPETKKNANPRCPTTKVEGVGIVEAKKNKECVPSVFLLPQDHKKQVCIVSYCDEVQSRTCVCKRSDGLNRKDINAKDVYTSNLHSETNVKETSVGLVGGGKQNRSCLASGEPEYTTQLEGSDGSSSSEGIVSRSKTDWKHSHRSFGEHLDFTLDVTRAERLGRAIAKAKRKRQWCRALMTIFGLVFFVLSVVIVSLSVTRGRKVFGSM